MEPSLEQKRSAVLKELGTLRDRMEMYQHADGAAWGNEQKEREACQTKINKLTKELRILTKELQGK